MRDVRGTFDEVEASRYGGIGVTEWYFPVIPNAVATGDIINTGGTFTITAGFVGYMSDGVASEVHCGSKRVPEKADTDGGWNIYAYVAPATAAQVSVVTVKVGVISDGNAISESSYSATGTIGTPGNVYKVKVASLATAPAAGNVISIRLGIDAGATGAILYGVSIEPM